MKYSTVVKNIKHVARKKLAEDEEQQQREDGDESSSLVTKKKKRGAATHVDTSPTLDSIDQRR